MDATIYALVLHPALHDLLRVQTGGGVTQEAIGWYGGIILSIFLIGWAIGGVRGNGSAGYVSITELRAYTAPPEDQNQNPVDGGSP